MSSKQMPLKHRASERVRRMRHNEPAPLRSYAGAAVTPVPHVAGMRTPANTAGSRHDGAGTVMQVTETAA
ncbi:MAG: hypothetical protein WBX11_05675 [Thiobacillaceae bacterium]